MSKWIFPALLLVFFVARADDFERLRQQALERKRQIIYNTDGCDAVYYPAQLAASKENFIAQRLAFTRNTAIDTVFYCPLSSGFTHLTSRTKAGDQLLTNAPHDKKTRNVTGELLALNTDPLKIAQEYCRAEGLEFFASLRVNDTHDTSHRPGNPYFLMNKFKRDNPQLLLGSFDNQPPYCAWSAVDFTHQIVRQRMKDVVAEICSNYDIDGIEYDFFRHLQLLKSVAWNGKATPEDLDMMTTFMRELREITEAAGRRRGRPILVAIRTTDSIGYSRSMGIDLERWMQEKLFDIWIAGGYFQLNPWQESVKLAQKYQLKFYASLDESRISSYLPCGHRNSDAVFAARAWSAIAEGCDGIYCFNLENKLLNARTRGGIKAFEKANKVYYATIRGGKSYINRYIANGLQFNNLKLISPENPQSLTGDKNIELDMFIDEKNLSAPDQQVVAAAMLRTTSQEPLQLRLNGKKLALNYQNDDVQEFAVPVQAIKQGVNRFEISTPAGNKVNWRMILQGDRILAGAIQYPWRRIFMTDDVKRSEVIVNKAYRLNDFMDGPRHAASFMYPLVDFQGDKLQYSFELKVESSDHPEAVAARTAFAGKTEVVTFEPDRISCKFAGKQVKFNTADRFHFYEITADGSQLQLKADGQLLLGVPLNMSSRQKASFVQNNSENVHGLNDSSIILGSITAPGKGSSLWRNVRLGEYGVKVNDFAVSIRYMPPVPRQLAQLAQDPIQALAAVEAAEGKLQVTNLCNSYKSHLSKVENDTILLIHDSADAGSGTQCFMQNRGGWLDNLPPVIVGEWQLKSSGSRQDFQCTLALPDANKKFRQLQIAVNSSSLFFNGRSAGAGVFRKNDFNTVRFAWDVRSGEYMLWCNQIAVDHGVLPPAANRKQPFLTVGDGSGKVAGKVQLKYFKLGTTGAETASVALADKTFVPAAAVEVKDGQVQIIGFQSSYLPHLCKVVDDAVHLQHDSQLKAEAYQNFSLKKHAWLTAPPENVYGEFAVKIPTTCGNNKCFQLTVALSGSADKKIRELNLTCAASGLLLNNRSITPRGVFKKDAFNQVSFDFNTVTGSCRIFCNGKLIHESVIKPRLDRKIGFITAGDGSGRIGGEVYMKYLRIGQKK